MGKKKAKRTVATPQHAHQLPLIGKMNPRLNKILAILRRRGRHTIKDISQELQVSYDTAKRAVGILRLEYGIRIEHDRKGNCIRLVEKVQENPKFIMVPFTETELRATALAAKSLLTVPETGLGQTMEKVHEKLSAMVPDIAEQNLNEDILTFGFTSKPIYRKGIVKKLLDCKARRRQVRILYETDPDPAEWRDVDPYGVRMVNEVLYLVAHCHRPDRNKPLTFCVTRIQDLEETGRTYQIPPGFSVAKFLKGAFGIVGGKKSFTVVVRFAKRFSYLVRERKWTGERKRIQLPDGSFDLHLRMKNMWEFQKMVMGHPGAFSVMEPVELRDAVAKAGMRIYRNNCGPANETWSGDVVSGEMK